ncbi:MAG: CotH kinase family protein [Bacteroidales bacterium]|nr:CotH kinase family protein [Bacteroidales bacterium]
MNKFTRLTLSLLLPLALFSCQPEENPGGENADVQSLMNIYYSEACFQRGAVNGDMTELHFTLGRSARISKEAMRVFDCTSKNLPEIGISYQKNEWTYNDMLSGVKVDKELPDDQAKPFCAAFTKNRLYIYLNNGNTLEIPDSPEGSLVSFIFRQADNYDLPVGFNCTIEGTTVRGVLPESTEIYRLAPTFRFRGKTLRVDGREQVSGRNKQDFSEAIKYELELFGGTRVTYSVQVVKGNTFPAVYIITDNNAGINSKETYVPGTIKIEDLDMRHSETKVLESRMKIKGRGNATWNMPKKPYRIKLDEAQKVLGMHKNKDWILLANYADKSLLRNVTAMKISEICGMAWTPQLYSVELYINGRYQGVYNLCDHKEVAKHRVDIEVADPAAPLSADVTGGYYLEIEQVMDEPVCWWTDRQVPMMFKDPSYPNAAQQSYVKQYFKDFEATLSGTGPGSVLCSGKYADYINVESFVNNYIVQELTKNIDGNLRKSSFLTKEKGKKLEMYHVWDFDFTLGNCDYFHSSYPGSDNSATGWFIRYYGLQGYGYGWYYKLMQDPAFCAKVKARWNELYPRLRDEVPAFIEAQGKYIYNAAGRNFKTWDILGIYVWPNQLVSGNYDAELAFLKQFYENRCTWLNEAINSL